MADTAAPLLETLRSNAAAAATQLVTAARAEAEALRSAARERAERARAVAIGAHERDAAIALSRTRAEAAARVGRDTLGARAAVLERVFAQAERRSGEVAKHPQAHGLLAATLDDAVSYLPEGPVKVVEFAPFGLTIESADGSMMVDGTFPRRLARERARLAAALARRLLEPAT